MYNCQRMPCLDSFQGNYMRSHLLAADIAELLPLRMPQLQRHNLASHHSYGCPHSHTPT